MHKISLAAILLIAGTALAGPIATGTFIALDPNTPTRGSLSIEKINDTLRLYISEDFSTSPAPDLHIILSRWELDEATNSNAHENGVIVAPLENNESEQEYILADSISIASYRTVLIHCIDYAHLFGGAQILLQTTKVAPRGSGMHSSHAPGNRTPLPQQFLLNGKKLPVNVSGHAAMQLILDYTPGSHRLLRASPTPER